LRARRSVDVEVATPLAPDFDDAAAAGSIAAEAAHASVAATIAAAVNDFMAGS
jgi:hypothetical protein